MTFRAAGELVDEAAARLAAAGISSGHREARLLLAHVLATDQLRLWAYPERLVEETAVATFGGLVDARRAGAPLSRLVGEREFWSLAFELSRDTLDPRPDSETLVEAALDVIVDRARPATVVDFGTGTGCLLLALLRELAAAHGVGVDLSAGAVATARRNAAALGLDGRASFVVGNWGAALTGRIDVILANPPYIRSDDISNLAPEVRDHDPLLALDGGADGLEAYRALAPDIMRLLSETGTAFLEVGAGQAHDVSEILERAGLETLAVRRDLNGIERCLAVRTAKT